MRLRSLFLVLLLCALGPASLARAQAPSVRAIADAPRHALTVKSPSPEVRALGDALRAAALARRAEHEHRVSAHGLEPEQRASLALLRRDVAGLRLHVRPGSRTPRALAAPVLERAAPGASGAARDLRTARRFLRRHRGLFRLANPDRELDVAWSRTDARGHRHLRFTQRMGALRVWPGALTAHFDTRGNLVRIDGAQDGTPGRVGTLPRVALAPAAAGARAALGLSAGAPVRRAELLVYAPGDAAPALAWRVELVESALEDFVALVHAGTGELLAAWNQVTTADVVGSGTDLFGVVRPLRVWEEGGTHYLVDTSKPMFDPTSDPPELATTRGAILTLDAQNQPPTSNPATIPPLFQITSPDPLSWPVSDGVSAAFNLSETYDYYFDVHGRDSYDGAGANVQAVVRLGLGYQNAFWNPGLELIAFGDGLPFAGALDVVAHEITHAVISETADLIYLNQSGAANEAFADIFGESAQGHSAGAPPDWALGAELGLVIRDLADPGSLEICCGRFYPERMSEYIGPNDPLLDLFPNRDNGGVHLNSTILGHAYYLLAEGLPSAIGLADAEDIFYRALAFHLVANSQFIDVRLACVQAAEDLFGVGSDQAVRTGEAFDAVEIFDGGGTPDPPPVPGVPADDSIVFLFFDPLFGYLLGRREAALGDPVQGVLLSPFDLLNTRPTVSGDGSVAFYVDALGDLCSVPTDGTGTTICNGTPFTFASVAIARDGSKLALVEQDVFGNRSNEITVLDLFDPAGDVVYVFAGPIGEGPVVANILWADALSFRIDSQLLAFDALNRLEVSGQPTVDVWSIYAIDLQADALLSLVDPAPDADFGWPAFSQTSPSFLVFDAVEYATNDSTIWATNLVTGTSGAIATAAQSSGIPFYTGDDAAVVYAQPDANPTGFSLWQRPVAADRITPAGPATPYLADANFAVVYRRGPFTGPPPDVDLDGIPDETDNCPHAPNASQSDLGGLQSDAADGIGDVCQCGDVNDDGEVRPADVGMVQEFLAGLDPAGFTQGKCSTSGALECDVLDAATLHRALAGTPTPLAPVCAPAVP